MPLDVEPFLYDEILKPFWITLDTKHNQPLSYSLAMLILLFSTYLPPSSDNNLSFHLMLESVRAWNWLLKRESLGTLISFFKRHPAMCQVHVENLKQLGVSLESVELLKNLTEDQISELLETLSFIGILGVDLLYTQNVELLLEYLHYTRPGRQDTLLKDRHQKLFSLSDLTPTETFGSELIEPSYFCRRSSPDLNRYDVLSECPPLLSGEECLESLESSKIVHPLPLFFSSTRDSQRTFAGPALSGSPLATQDISILRKNYPYSRTSS
jgi:hypothetical protein